MHSSRSEYCSKNSVNVNVGKKLKNKIELGVSLVKEKVERKKTRRRKQKKMRDEKGMEGKREQEGKRSRGKEEREWKHSRPSTECFLIKHFFSIH